MGLHRSSPSRLSDAVLQDVEYVSSLSLSVCLSVCLSVSLFVCRSRHYIVAFAIPNGIDSITNCHALPWVCGGGGGGGSLFPFFLSFPYLSLSLISPSLSPSLPMCPPLTDTLHITTTTTTNCVGRRGPRSRAMPRLSSPRSLRFLRSRLRRSWRIQSRWVCRRGWGL